MMLARPGRFRGLWPLASGAKFFSLLDALNAVSLVAYAAATAVYLAFHGGLRPPLARAGWALLLLGWAVQTVDIGIRCVHGQHPASSITEAMAFTAWMIVGGYLIASLRYRIEAVGAFAVPAALILLLLARVVPGGENAPPGGLGVMHVFLATLGVAAFALAAAIEIVYLVQARRLKRKRFDRLGGGNAPLESLDRLAARIVSIGFPVFTLALVTGAVWVARLGLVRVGSRPEYVLAVASWLAFGILLVARAGAGWQGRRAAWLTVAGFSGVILVVLGYFVRLAV
jgi:ABC-type uncharacterized transport system permease subunit